MFINGEKLEGAVGVDEVKAVLNQQLLAAGVQPPVESPAAQPKSSSEKSGGEKPSDPKSSN
jgi:hypothetical protein